MNQDAIDKQYFDDAVDALKVAKITMMMQKNTTFYTTILFSLKQTISSTMPGMTTAATDGRDLYVHPKFFIDLTPNERITLLAHEALHVALDHMHRIGNRDPKLWNIAADYVINGSLKKAGYTLPQGGLYDQKYDGMTTEEVYNILDKKSDTEKANLIKPCNGGAGAMNGQDIQYPDPQDQDQVTQEDVTEIILRATTQAKAMGQEAGSLPGEIEIELQRTLNPPLPWNVILQHYLTDYAKDDYSFRRPNRRFMPDHYMPVAYSEAIANIAIFVDASCSVSPNDFNTMITKIAEIQATMNPKKITVIAFDTQIKSVQELTEDDNPFKKLKFKGRGGTRIAPVHTWIGENKPTVTIVFTDGEFPQTDPVDRTAPIIWLIHDDPKWKSKVGGRVVHYNIDKK